MKNSKFKIWKTIRICPHDADAIVATIMSNGNKITDGTIGIMERKYDYRLQDYIKLSREHKTINLVKVSVADLKFKEAMHYYHVIDGAIKEFGLKACPFELGPQLRIKYQDQPLGEELYIPVERPDGVPLFYYCYMVSNINGILYLNAQELSKHSLGLKQQLIFCL